jgi:uncharacterized membrane protein
MIAWRRTLDSWIVVWHQRSWRERLFLLGVLFKGFDGTVELLGGVALLSVSPAFVLRSVQFLTQDEIIEDPHDLVANYLLRLAARLSVGSQHFMALYLLLHGIVKMALVWALLERVLIAYPVSILAFAAFIAYQLYRSTLVGGFGLWLLSALDVAVVTLVYLEYRAMRQGRAPGRGGT